MEPRWEMTIVDTDSISFVVNRLYKVFHPIVLLILSDSCM